MTLCQCRRISFLRSFFARNVEAIWVRYPVVTKLWIFHVVSVRILEQAKKFYEIKRKPR